MIAAAAAEEYLTARQVAEATGYSAESIRLWAATGKIPAVRAVNSWEIPASAVAEIAAWHPRSARPTLLGVLPGARSSKPLAVATLLLRYSPDVDSDYDEENGEPIERHMTETTERLTISSVEAALLIDALHAYRRQNLYGCSVAQLRCKLGRIEELYRRGVRRED